MEKLQNFANMMKYLLLRLLILMVFSIILILIIAFARGYRFDLTSNTVTSTGILSVNSAPKPAQVYIDGELKGVTDINLTLPNGKYTVEVKKEGYSDWKKEITLKGEIVMSVDPVLFSKNPSLSPLTNIGVNKAVLIGQTEKILLFSQTGNIEKDGIYLFDASKKPLAIFPPLKTVVLKSLFPEGIDLTQAEIDFSPNYQEALFTFPLTEETSVTYLIPLEQENLELVSHTSTSKETILALWNEEKNKELVKIMETFPKDIRKVATDSFHLLALSPDETKFLYQAKKAVTLPLVIKPQLIGANQTPEERTLQEGSIYVYDKKEDKNFKISFESMVQKDLSITPSPSPTLTPTPLLEATPTPTLQLLDENRSKEILSQLQWFPDSRHLVIKKEKVITVIDYDGTNTKTIYSGPFENEFFALNPDWNLLVLVNLNSQNNEYGDLYSIGVR